MVDIWQVLLFVATIQTSSFISIALCFHLSLLAGFLRDQRLVPHLRNRTKQLDDPLPAKYTRLTHQVHIPFR